MKALANLVRRATTLRTWVPSSPWIRSAIVHVAPSLFGELLTLTCFVCDKRLRSYRPPWQTGIAGMRRLRPGKRLDAFIAAHQHDAPHEADLRKIAELINRS